MRGFLSEIMTISRRRVYFVKPSDTPFAEPKPDLVNALRERLLVEPGFAEATEPDAAEFLIVHETTHFKDWRYNKRLMNDPLIGRFLHKTLTLSTDDSAPGLLPGVYACLQANRFSNALHRAVPYHELVNPLIEKSPPRLDVQKKYLASWRGNTKSNKRLRSELVRSLGHRPRFCVETTDTWFNHSNDEHKRYVDLIQSSSFSLCPAGWASNTFRTYDSMALGVCPVILADLWVPPLGPKWEDFCIFVKEKSVAHLEQILSQREHEADRRGQLAYEAWCEFFAGRKMMTYYVNSLVSLIDCLVPTSPEKELARWNSYAMYWNNGWTLGQRVARRVRKLLVP